jgi:O-antigen/teichoic acid export membrane protein
MKERSLFANTAWGMIAQVLRGLTALVFIPLVIGSIGVAGYGIYSLLMLLSFYQGLMLQADFGYTGFLINWAAKTENWKNIEGLKKRVRTSLTGLFCINSAMWVLCLFFSSQVGAFFKVQPEDMNQFQRSLHLIFAANFFSMVALVAGGLWISRHRNVQYKHLELGQYFFFFLMSLVLLQKEASVASLALAFLLSQVLFAAALFIQTRKHFSVSVIPGAFSWREIKGDWSGWKPFLSSRLTNMAQRQSDMTLVTIILGPQFLAIYDISMKLPSVLKTLLGRVSEALVPFASKRSLSTDHSLIRNLSQRLVSLEVALGILTTSTFLFFGPELSQLWLGPDQRFLGENFFLASWVNIVTPPLSILMAILIAQGRRNSELTWYPGWIALANVLLAIPVTYYFGIRGTILLTVIQFAVLSAVCIHWAKKDFQFSAMAGWKTWVKVGVPALLVNFLAKQFLPPVEDKTSFLFSFVAVQIGLAGFLWYLIHKEVLELRKLMQTKA